MDLEARFQLALAAQRSGATSEAARQYEELLRVAPDHPSVLVNLGTIRLGEGRLDEATRLLERAALVAPEHANARCQLGLAYSRQGRLEDADRSFATALALAPNHLAALNNRALGLAALRRFDEAFAHFQRAVEVAPESVQAMQNLGGMLIDLGRLTEAEALLRRAISLAPDDAPLHVNLANVHSKRGRPLEAIECLERALALRPNSAAWHSNLLLTLHYPEGPSRAAVFAEHLAWARRHGASARPLAMDALSRREFEGRRLRVGFVSPDLRAHAVAFFLDPLVREIDRARFELHAYANVAVEDATSATLRGAFDRWTNVYALDDASLAERIRSDGIDILVDLAGHTSGNRLTAFALGPAPFQMTYLGYPDTTGVAAIDFRLTDRVCEPTGSEAFHSEELLYLEGGMHCYGPPRDAPPVAPPPFEALGHLTFGSMSNTSKITESVIARWAKVLTAVPSSRMWVKFPTLDDLQSADSVRHEFARHGIESDRVTLHGGTFSHRSHLDAHRHVDVVLDTFPYHGTTTTCEALWMGVPVLTLVGDRHVSRVGASLLGQVGLKDLAVESEEAMVAVATTLDTEVGRARLRRLRCELRTTMSRSPLCDAKATARQLERCFSHVVGVER